MKQERFESLYASQWIAFEAWLAYHKKPAKARKGMRPPFADSELPQRYRALCRLFSLAQDRHFSLALVEHLHHLVQEGHDILYQTPSGFLQHMVDYVTAGFAVDVRKNWPYVLASALCFLGSYFIIMAAVRIWPDFSFVLLPYEQIFMFRDMYSDQQVLGGGLGQADSRVRMFGFYVMHNTSIGFQCFAGGLLVGLPTLFSLGFNGIYMGAVEADLWNAGLGHNFYAFVAGHSTFELGAIILCGAAGFKLGTALISPGRRQRGEALRYAAKSVIGIVAGSVVMFFAAALIEAFWSSIPTTNIPFGVKIGVGFLLLTLTLLYFLIAGRSRAN